MNPRLLATFLSLSFVAASFAQLDVASIYSKSETMIPMRDGVKLFTAIYAPKNPTGKSPLLIVRTPYSCRPYGPTAFRERLGSNDNYMKENFTFVYQDVRGRYMSEGVFADIRPQL